MGINVFSLFAKLGFNADEFDKGVDNASKGFEELGDAAAGVAPDTAKAEAAIDKLAAAVADATDDTHGLSAEAQANANKVKVLAARHEMAKEKVEKLRKEFNETAKKTGTASDETMVLANSLAKAEKECDEYADSLKKIEAALNGTEGGTTSFWESIAGGVVKGNILTNIATSLWNGVKQVAGALWNLDEATEDYRVAMGKLNTAFDVAGYSGTAAKKTFTEFYKILGDTDTATEASQLLARLSTNQEDLARWTTIAAGVNGTFGDSLPIEGLIEAANETAKVGQVTGVLADALNWVGISEDDFNIKLAECANTTERTALITETLEAKYSDAADALRENNAVVIAARESQLRLQDGQAKLGEQTSRLKTALSTGLAPAMEKLYAWTEKLTKEIADSTEEWAKWANEIHRPITTDNIEEAREQVEAWKTELKEVTEALIMLADTGSAELTQRQSELNAKIKNGTLQIEEMEAAAAANTEATTENAEAVNKMTVSAHGFTVELQGCNLTMEEATERLNTYTDAATNMFSKINTESELSYQNALDNLAHNIEATQAFGDNMVELAGVLPKELADMFAAGGPEMYAGIVAMLAEANKGTDAGLAQLNELYAQGGAAAVQAFIEASTGIPVDMETPASVLAASMDNDVSSETAAQNVVYRAATAMQESVNTAGFDYAGARAMDKFIDGMNSRRYAVNRTAEIIAQGAANTINSALSGIGAGGGGRYSAGGLDYVPFNGYPSILHRGEAVLTADEADEWRRGKNPAANSRDVTIIQNIQTVPLTPVEVAAATAAYFEQARWAL